MTLKALQIIADSRIQEGIAAGKFKDLPGLGRPLEYDPLDYDPHAWIREKLRSEGLSANFLAAKGIESARLNSSHLRLREPVD